jgi:hypothetical protein
MYQANEVNPVHDSCVNLAPSASLISISYLIDAAGGTTPKGIYAATTFVWKLESIIIVCIWYSNKRVIEVCCILFRALHLPVSHLIVSNACNHSLTAEFFS